MGIYMGPIRANHKGLVRDLQHGSMMDPHGQSHMGTIWVQYGKINPHLSSTKKQQQTFRHFYTNVPSPSPYDGLVRSQQRETLVHVQVIAHA